MLPDRRLYPQVRLPSKSDCMLCACPGALCDWIQLTRVRTLKDASPEASDPKTTTYLDPPLVVHAKL